MSREDDARDKEQSFYLNGKTYYPNKLTVETWAGRYKDDYYDYDRLPAEDFIEKMVEAAKEHGRNEIRNEFRKLLNLKDNS